MKNLIRQWLGINHDIREIKKDVIACMEKQLTFQKQYPVDDPDALPPPRPNMSEAMSCAYEYLSEEVDDGINGEWFAIWKYGFAGPFNNQREAEFYINENELADKVYGAKATKIYRYGLKDKVTQ